MEWTREVRMDSEDEKEKKPKKTRKPRSEVPSGDESEPRKKRRGKLRKPSPGPGEEEGAMFTEEERAERPAKKVVTYLFTSCSSELISVIHSEQRKNGSSETRMTKRLVAHVKSNCE